MSDVLMANRAVLLSRTVSILGRMRWLLFVVILLAFGLDTMMTLLDNAERKYGEASTSDWAHTNYSG